MEMGSLQGRAAGRDGLGEAAPVPSWDLVFAVWRAGKGSCPISHSVTPLCWLPPDTHVSPAHTEHLLGPRKAETDWILRGRG